MHTSTHEYITGVYIYIYIYLYVDYNYNTPICNTKFAEVTVSSLYSFPPSLLLYKSCSKSVT